MDRRELFISNIKYGKCSDDPKLNEEPPRRIEYEHMHRLQNLLMSYEQQKKQSKSFIVARINNTAYNSGDKQ